MKKNNIQFTVKENTLILQPKDQWPDKITFTQNELSELLKLLSQQKEQSKVERFNLHSASLTDRGLNPKRTVNEDKFLVKKEYQLFAVMDGVGGHQAGEVASAMAADILEKCYSEQKAENDFTEQEQFLRFCIKQANEAIFQKSNNDTSLRGMASTIDVLKMVETKALILNVGDSRIYCIRKGEIEQITKDHSKVQEMLDNERITVGKNLLERNKHIITKALGLEKNVEPGFKIIDVKPDDLFLLTTDGVTDMLGDDELLQIVEQSNNLQGLCEGVKEQCYNNGATDNLTIVAVRVMGNTKNKASESEIEDEIQTKIR